VPIKALRVQIIKPFNTDYDSQPVTWDELGRTLRDLRYAASKMANYVIQQNYMWELFRQQYKQEHGSYPSVSEHKDKLYCYPRLTAMFPLAAGQMVNQIERHAKTVWSARKSEVLKLHQSVPSFKLNFPIIVHRDSYRISEVPEEGKSSTHVFLLQANLLSREAATRTRYSFLINAGEKSKQTIVERIISGEYRQGALQIVGDRKNKWYCIIPYEFKTEENNTLDPQCIMGIDLGISKAVYWAIIGSHKRGWIDGHEIEEFRRRVQARRKSIQEQGKYCGDGRIGHGRKRRLLPIEVLENRESNFKNTTNHRYSRFIIEAAIKNQCGVIQMEDLSGINERSTFLRNWTYYDLQMKIKAKAEEVGIEVRIVNPQYTSQRCSQCGHIDRDNRPNQATFVCTHCGYGGLYHCFACGKSQVEAGVCHLCGGETKIMKINADYNAARNLAICGIDQIIVQTLEGEGG
jgi:IS605 OrfB family transposase